MNATVTLDPALVDQARRVTGVSDLSGLINEALTALIQREVQRRLADSSALQPDAQIPPRRRRA